MFGLQREPDDSLLRDALRKANCDFIVDSWSRLNDPVGDLGEGLSSGQKQRLSLARALLREPLVLLLDEPTANLDNESQIKFIESLRELKNKISIILITHRSELLDLSDNRIDLDVL